MVLIPTKTMRTPTIIIVTVKSASNDNNNKTVIIQMITSLD